MTPSANDSVSTSAPRIIIALDYPSAQPAMALAQQLDPRLCRLKIGNQLFTRCGPPLLETLIRQGFSIFLDLKFHDIPNTVAGACKAAAELGVWMITLHAAGGSIMLTTAREALAAHKQAPLLIAVTVLTSLDHQQLQETGINAEPQQQVLRLAQLSQRAGLDGVVCSAQEAALLRRQMGSDFCLVTPGIRLDNASSDDQQRVMTPAAAIRAGADYLVIGRPVTQASDPLAVLEQIQATINLHVLSS